MSPSSKPDRDRPPQGPGGPGGPNKPRTYTPKFGSGKFGEKARDGYGPSSGGKPTGKFGPKFGPKAGGKGFKSGYGKPGFGPGGGRPGSFEASLPRSVRVVHEDADVLIIDKPPGLLTANIPGETRTALFDMLKQYIRHTRPRLRRDRERDENGPKARSAGQGVYVIHRLDKEASGLLVFATSEKAFGWLKDDFKTKRVHRIYTALVEGEIGPVGQQGTIQSFLREMNSGKVESLASDTFRGAGRAGGHIPASTDADDTAKLAVTHYRVIGVGHGMTLVQVRLETGRKHQIRVHLADRGHPLVGDIRYGAKNDSLARLALHASELGFTHPGTGQTVRYNSYPPPMFYKAVGMEPPRQAERVEAVQHGVELTPGVPVLPVTGDGARDARDSQRDFSSEQRREPSRDDQRSAGRDQGSKGPTSKTAPNDTSWERVAEWYDAMQGEGGDDASDHYRDVIIPGTVRLVQPRDGMRVLDVACGQGVISRALASLGAGVVGVDAAPSLVDAARSRGGGEGQIDYRVGDARELGTLGLGAGEFDAATAIMALGNIEPLEPVFRAVAEVLKPGGRFVAVLSHPAFRAPGQTGWGWDERTRTQFRRIDGYLSHGQNQIQMHPGKAAHGQAGGDITTWTFHRPLQTYVRLLSEAGLLIEAIEEWSSRRVSEPGPRGAEENRSRREIPLFLAWRAVKVARAVV